MSGMQSLLLTVFSQLLIALFDQRPSSALEKGTVTTLLKVPVHCSPLHDFKRLANHRVRGVWCNTAAYGSACAPSWWPRLFPHKSVWLSYTTTWCNNSPHSHLNRRCGGSVCYSFSHLETQHGQYWSIRMLMTHHNNRTATISISTAPVVRNYRQSILVGNTSDLIFMKAYEKTGWLVLSWFVTQKTISQLIFKFLFLQLCQFCPDYNIYHSEDPWPDQQEVNLTAMFICRLSNHIWPAMGFRYFSTLSTMSLTEASSGTEGSRSGPPLYHLNNRPQHR